MSSGSESSGQKVLLEPYKSVGAQDLIKISYSYCGYLRKRGAKERIFGGTKWTRKYCVISQGCIYCYRNELSDKPLSAFSLYLYESVKEAEYPNGIHCFEIIHEDHNKTGHVFSCDTSERRKTWIEHINEAIIQCHQHSGEKLSADSDEGIVITNKPRGRPTLPLPSVPGSSPTVTGSTAKNKKYKAAKSEYDLESTDDEDPYDEVENKNGSTPVTQTMPKTPPKPLLPTSKPLPPTVGNKTRTFPGAQSVLPVPDPSSLRHRQSMSERQPVALPYQKARSSSSSNIPTASGKPPKPDDEPLEGYINLFPEEEYLLDSSDRVATENALSDKPDGTFLIRKSSKGGQVLAVKTRLGIKSFQIVNEANGKVSLDKIKYFPCIGALLCFYHKNLLPKSEYQAKLKSGYLSEMYE